MRSVVGARPSRRAPAVAGERCGRGPGRGRSRRESRASAGSQRLRGVSRRSRCSAPGRPKGRSAMARTGAEVPSPATAARPAPRSSTPSHRHATLRRMSRSLIEELTRDRQTDPLPAFFGAALPEDSVYLRVSSARWLDSEIKSVLIATLEHHRLGGVSLERSRPLASPSPCPAYELTGAMMRAVRVEGPAVVPFFRPGIPLRQIKPDSTAFFFPFTLSCPPVESAARGAPEGVLCPLRRSRVIPQGDHRPVLAFRAAPRTQAPNVGRTSRPERR